MLYLEGDPETHIDDADADITHFADVIPHQFSFEFGAPQYETVNDTVVGVDYTRPRERHYATSIPVNFGGLLAPQFGGLQYGVSGEFGIAAPLEGVVYAGSEIFFPPKPKQNTRLNITFNGQSKRFEFDNYETLGPVVPNPDSLYARSVGYLDINGNVAPFVSRDFPSRTAVRRFDTILPGVDLTCIPSFSRGILIAPDLVAIAEHVGRSARTWYFHDNADALHTSQTSAISERLGGLDLVVHRLNNPLPPTIKPAKLLPANVSTRASNLIPDLYGYRMDLNDATGMRLSVGSARMFRGNGIGFDIDSLPELPSNLYATATGGDSGGAMFLVIDGDVVATSSVSISSDFGIAIYSMMDEIQDFYGSQLPTIEV